MKQGARLALWVLLFAARLVRAPGQRLRLLAPANGTHLAPGVPWLFHAEVEEHTDERSMLVLQFEAQPGSRTSLDVMKDRARDRPLRIWMPAFPDIEREDVMIVSLELLGRPLETVHVHVQVRMPLLTIFYPFDNEPALIAPGRPLTINFGLTACLMGVPDCFADFQGAQYEHAEVLLDDEPVGQTDVSRLHIPFEALPEGIWRSGVEEYTRDGGMLQRESTLTVIVVSRYDRQELVIKSKRIILVAPAAAVRAAADIPPRAGLGGTDLFPSFKRHVYADPPMGIFGDTFERELAEHEGRSTFFSSWGARSARASRLQPQFLEPWVPMAADRVGGPGEEEEEESSGEGARESTSNGAYPQRSVEGSDSIRSDRALSGGQAGSPGIYAFVFVHKDPLDFIMQVALFRKFVQEPVSFIAVLNLDELDPEYHRSLARWRVVARSLDVAPLKSRLAAASAAAGVGPRYPTATSRVGGTTGGRHAASVCRFG